LGDYAGIFVLGPKFSGNDIICHHCQENGMSNIEWVSLDGKVHDPQRIDFLQRYLQQYQRAIDEGMKLAAILSGQL
jgi:beta-glucosidase/6-phospho-beta-glucosidase/beta-galactosidase